MKKPAQAYTIYEDDTTDAPKKTYEIENEEVYYEEGYMKSLLKRHMNKSLMTRSSTTYLDGRRRFGELRNNRGFYPVVALTDSPTSSSTSTAQRPFPPRSKGGKGKGF